MTPARGGLVPVLGAAGLLAATALLPGDAAAQEGPEGDVPEVAEAPRQFRIGAAGSALLWEETEGRIPDDGSVWGLDVERVLFRYASLRLDAAYGAGSVRAAEDSVDVTTYLAELVLAARIAPPALERAGVIPFLAAGVGTLVHDPDREGLPTASQNALSWGFGVEAVPFDRFGFRAEWRRYDVDLENVFDAVDRSGLARNASRIQVTAFWTF